MHMNPLFLPAWPPVEFDAPCLATVAELEAGFPGYSYPIDEFDTLDEASAFPGGYEAWCRFQRHREREQDRIRQEQAEQQAAAELSTTVTSLEDSRQ